MVENDGKAKSDASDPFFNGLLTNFDRALQGHFT
jgi:hypothetical protein